MLILTKKKIQEAIRRCKPLQIAVAYIGGDWRKYISEPSALETVIISPTIGTNPYAVCELAKYIGWERILFLNELHAKIYLSQYSAVVGSANLTYNGLSGESLIELCVEINDRTYVRDLKNLFADIKKKAQNQYPTTESKKERIKELEKTWGAAISIRIFPKKNKRQNHFRNFEVLAKDHFYVIWYQPTSCEYSDDVNKLESVIADDLHFSQKDDIERNKWALTWRVTNKWIPHKTVIPSWLYIHDIFENGIVDEGYEYPKVAIQRSDMEIPSPPFEITKEVAIAFNKAIIEGNVAKYLMQKDKIFSLEYSLKGIPILFDKMKQYLANKAEAAAPASRRG